jgi:glycosyltransferase involved in cell wall biosynthesis
MGVNVSSEVSYLQDINQGEFTIVCPANIIPVKGHEYLIKACDIIRKRDADFLCLIIGDGMLEDKLKTEVDNMALGDYIHFTGRMPHHELMDMYQQGNVDVVVLPSINTDDGEHEGIPVALMEAMVYGIPVISTKTGGIPELLDNGAGILVHEKSAKELADAIEILINDPLLKRQIGVQGRFRVERDFNLEQNTNNLLKLMKKQVEK